MSLSLLKDSSRCWISSDQGYRSATTLQKVLSDLIIDSEIGHIVTLKELTTNHVLMIIKCTLLFQIVMMFDVSDTVNYCHFLMIQTGRHKSWDKFQSISCQLLLTSSWNVNVNVEIPYKNFMKSQLIRSGTRYTDIYRVVVRLEFWSVDNEHSLF